jgi:hypothetical protein
MPKLNTASQYEPLPITGFERMRIHETSEKDIIEWGQKWRIPPYNPNPPLDLKYPFSKLDIKWPQDYLFSIGKFAAAQRLTGSITFTEHYSDHVNLAVPTRQPHNAFHLYWMMRRDVISREPRLQEYFAMGATDADEILKSLWFRMKEDVRDEWQQAFETSQNNRTEAHGSTTNQQVDIDDYRVEDMFFQPHGLGERNTNDLPNLTGAEEATADISMSEPDANGHRSQDDILAERVIQVDRMLRQRAAADPELMTLVQKIINRQASPEEQ